jgi:hypothetical protein
MVDTIDEFNSLATSSILLSCPKRTTTKESCSNSTPDVASTSPAAADFASATIFPIVSFGLDGF